MPSNRRDSKIYKICLTGGPCAGKTTALKYLSTQLADKYSILTVPEIGTLTVESGFSIIPSRFTEETQKSFNQSISQFQIDLEKYYESLALLMEKPVLMVIDRGVVDNFGYVSTEIRERILKDTQWDMNSIRNERYDLVIHMVTAAIGAEKFYSGENNQARTETVDEAIDVDGKVLNEWLGYPNLVVIDNSISGIETKLQRVEHCIKNLVEGPQLETKYIKFLLDKVYTKQNLPKNLFTESFSETAYEKEFDNSIYVERTYEADGLKAYYCINRESKNKNGEMHELKHLISDLEFKQIIETGNSCKFTKQVIAFSYANNRSLNLCLIETFENKGLVSVLKVDKDIDSNDSESSLLIIPFIQIREIYTHASEDNVSYIEY